MISYSSLTHKSSCFVFLQAGDGDKYYRDTQVTETITSRHTASQYRPVDFRLPVGGGHFGDISGMYSFQRIQWHYTSSYERSRSRAYESDFIVSPPRLRRLKN